jgi:hypothetical protein
MKLRHAIVAAALLLFARGAFAQSTSTVTTYTYTGNVFTYFYNSDTCPPECSISGSFTMPQPLAPNLPWPTAVAGYTSFTFTDGINVIDSANVSQVYDFDVQTNAAGDIVQWVLYLYSYNGSQYLEMITGNWGSLEWGYNGYLDYTESYNYNTGIWGDAESYPSSGTWSTTFPAPPPNQYFVIESTTTEPSAGTSEVSDPNATQQCSVASPCAQNLFFTFDTSNGQQATLGNPNVLWATNSILDNNGTSINFLNNLCTSPLQMSVPNDDGTTYSIAIDQNPCTYSSSSVNPATGSYCILTGTTCGETGNVTMYAFADPSGEYFGSFNDTTGSQHSQSNSGKDYFSLQVNPDFSVTAELDILPKDLCPAQTSTLTLSSTSPEAINYAGYPTNSGGIIVGDVVLMDFADNLGNVLSVVAWDHDANGNVLPAGSLYVTGTSMSGVCGSNTSFWDAPFSKKGVIVKPIIGRRQPPHSIKQIREWAEKMRTASMRPVSKTESSLR